jgi:hypothetical protein
MSNSSLDQRLEEILRAYPDDCFNTDCNPGRKSAASLLRLQREVQTLLQDWRNNKVTPNVFHAVGETHFDAYCNLRGFEKD